MFKINSTKKIVVLSALFTAVFIVPALAQKYKTAADTADLNKEYNKLTAQIANDKTQLTTANDKLPDLESKSTQIGQNAQKSAQESKDQAATAAGGNIKQINKEEKMARKANSMAEDSKDAQNELKDQQKKIKKLNADIEKKQKRLADLDQQRSAIMALPKAA